MKKALICGMALAFVCGAGFISMSAAENQGPEIATITDGTDASKKPAYFPHWDHQNRLKDCSNCHHGEKDGKQVAYEAGKGMEKKCHTCHNADKFTLEGKKPGVSPIQRAGHGRCQGCHKESQSTNGTSLLACGTCHEKHKPAN